MTVLAIAIKDLKQFSRNIPYLVMSLAAPLVLTAIMGFAFAGLAGGGAPRLQVTTMRVANLDRGQAGLPVNLGQKLVDVLQGPGFDKIVRVAVVADAAGAQAAVEKREAETALIIPPDFSAAVMSQDGRTAQLILYHDPALAMRPAIVASALQGVLDVFSASKVAAQVTAEQLAGRGAPAAAMAEAASRVAEQYARAAQGAPLITVQTGTTSGAPSEGLGTLTAQVNAAMLVFFLFFTAATAAESILKEDQERTLPRLFTTPAARSAVLGGKLVSVFAIVLVQAVILLAAGAVLFGVRWGNAAGVAVQVVAVTVAAGGLGLLLIAISRDQRQAGYVMGAVLTILGVPGVFTVGFRSLPKVMSTLSLFTPHGWAMKGWNALLQSEGVAAVLGPAAVCLATGLVFFGLGTAIVRRRYAG